MRCVRREGHISLRDAERFARGELPVATRLAYENQWKQCGECWRRIDDARLRHAAPLTNEKPARASCN